MERILDKLRAHADVAPNNALLRDIISLLSDVQRRPDGPYPVSWSALCHDFRLLQDHGLWERSTENDELLDALHTQLMSPTHKRVQGPVGLHGSPSSSEEIPVIIPPAQYVSSQLIGNQGRAVLPVEVINVLDNAYFLHILATDPTQVLPPGKSLLSVMSRSSSTVDEATKPTLRSRVEDLVHKAFWDGAVDTLSNPEPSVQLSRIKLLYGDIYVALSPLLPLDHPVLTTLSSPLSPTSSPLDSALTHLQEVLTSLHERCAPARDPEVETIQQLLNDPSIRSSRPVALATLVAEIFRNIMSLSANMKDDLSRFVLGSMSERQLGSVVTQQARTKEREIVIDMWRQDRIMREWASWLDKLYPPAHLSTISAEPRYLWIVRIVQALGSSSPVFCPLPLRTTQASPPPSSNHDSDGTTEPPTPNANVLPPVFFLSVPTLLKTQNYLQALVIAASLNSLTRYPAFTHTSTNRSDRLHPDSFMSRVWTLLHAEIAEGPDAGDTKLINLADELVRARRQAAAMPSAQASISLPKEDDTTLRAAVNRTLQADNPVYKLLQRRLLTELSNVLVKRRQGEAIASEPLILRTGRAGKRPRPMLDLEGMGGSRPPLRGSPLMVTDVKGFEDPVLSQATSEVFEQVDKCMRWVENVWGDVIEAGHVKVV